MKRKIVVTILMVTMAIGMLTGCAPILGDVNRGTVSMITSSGYTSIRPSTSYAYLENAVNRNNQKILFFGETMTITLNCPVCGASKSVEITENSPNAGVIYCDCPKQAPRGPHWTYELPECAVYSVWYVDKTKWEEQQKEAKKENKEEES